MKKFFGGIPMTKIVATKHTVHQRAKQQRMAAEELERQVLEQQSKESGTTKKTTESTSTIAKQAIDMTAVAPSTTAENIAPLEKSQIKQLYVMWQSNQLSESLRAAIVVQAKMQLWQMGELNENEREELESSVVGSVLRAWDMSKSDSPLRGELDHYQAEHLLKMYKEDQLTKEQSQILAQQLAATLQTKIVNKQLASEIMTLVNQTHKGDAMPVVIAWQKGAYTSLDGLFEVAVMENKGVLPIGNNRNILDSATAKKMIEDYKVSDEAAILAVRNRMAEFFYYSKKRPNRYTKNLTLDKTMFSSVVQTVYKYFNTSHTEINKALINKALTRAQAASYQSSIKRDIPAIPSIAMQGVQEALNARHSSSNESGSGAAVDKISKPSGP